MKIAIIGQKGIPALSGGTERHVEELSTHLADLGHSVYVYTRPWYSEKLKVQSLKSKVYEGIHLISLPSIRTKHLDAISHTLFASIHTLFQDFDIIHYHGVGPALLCWIPCLFKPKTKIIGTFHCQDSKHQKWNWFAKRALELGEKAICLFPHQIIVVSKTLQKYCQEKYNKETVYVPNGISDKIISDNSRENSRLISDFHLKPQKYILMVSRLVRHKGVHYLIEAFKKYEWSVKRSKAEFDKKLVIVGEGAHTNDYVNELKKLAGNNKNIIFTGAQHGKILEALFKNAYLFILPSEAEGLSTAILEAMAYGLPVLASDIPENMELVKDYGWHFKNKDVSDLKNKLEDLINHPDLIKEKAEKARKFILENYNWSDIVKHIERLYAGVLIKEKMVTWLNGLYGSS